MVSEGVPVSATDELRERLVRAVLRPHPKVELRPGEWATDVGPVVDELAELVAAVVAEARTEEREKYGSALIELADFARSTPYSIVDIAGWIYSFIREGITGYQLLSVLEPSALAALRGVGNQKVGVTVDDLALDEMDGNQNAEPERHKVCTCWRLNPAGTHQRGCDFFVADQKGTEQ